SSNIRPRSENHAICLEIFLLTELMAMSFRNSCLLAACVWVGVQATPLMAQEDGAYLFKTYCAICHEAENGEEERAPNRDVLKQMTPEHILQVLETGAMKTEAAERSRAQRRILAEHLSEKKFGNAEPDLIARSAFCTNSAAPSNSPGDPQWNGWGGRSEERRGGK